jgi:hypothetical protein
MDRLLQAPENIRQCSDLISTDPNTVMMTKAKVAQR